jgi:nucleotide-binding universal stress UspA family protein
MKTKILIPLDGSVCAERVLAHLRWLAPPENSEIVLIRVVESAYYVYGSMGYAAPDLLTSIYSEAEQYLQAQALHLRELEYAVTTKVCVGDPASEILDVAKSQKVDLVAMSTHGRSGFMRFILGSVAERVLQQVTVPTFLVRDGAGAPVTIPARILVPLDGSKFSEDALAKATELATRLKSELLLLNAFDNPTRMDMGLYVMSQAELDEEIVGWQEEMGAYLEGEAESLRAQGIVTQTRLAMEDAATAIDDTSVMEDVGLIVMSTHGRSGLQRWIFGSVANKALRMVECPLLLVRPPKVPIDEHS